MPRMVASLSTVVRYSSTELDKSKIVHMAYSADFTQSSRLAKIERDGLAATRERRPRGGKAACAACDGSSSPSPSTLTLTFVSSLLTVTVRPVCDIGLWYVHLYPFYR